MKIKFIGLSSTGISFKPLRNTVECFILLNVTVSSNGVPRWIGDWFKKADKNNDGRMNFKEVRDLLKMMNVDMNEHHAHHLFTVRAFESNI